MTSTQEQAQEAAAQAKDKAGEAAQKARGRGREQLDQRSTQAGERVSAQASDVRSVASALRDQGQEQPAKLADQAAERAEKLGGYLQDADTDRILGDLEDFGRRQPTALILGGLALGFVASRVVKASSQKRYETANGDRPTDMTRPAANTPLPVPAPRSAPGAVPGTLAGTGTVPAPAPIPVAPVRYPDPLVGDASADPLAPRPLMPDPVRGL